MKRFLSVLLLVSMFVSAGLAGGKAVAETDVSELDSQIQKAEEAKKQAEKRVKDLKEEIAELENNKGDILEYVKKVDKKMEKVSETISDLRKQINAARNSLVTLEKELKEAQAVEKAQYETMKKRIKYMYENGSGAYMDVVFSASSLADFLNRSEYIEKISKYDTNLYQTKQETARGEEYTIYRISNS